MSFSTMPWLRQKDVGASTATTGLVATPVGTPSAHPSRGMDNREWISHHHEGGFDYDEHQVGSPPSEGRLEDNSFLYGGHAASVPQAPDLMLQTAFHARMHDIRQLAEQGVSDTRPQILRGRETTLEERLARRCDRLESENKELSTSLLRTVREMEALEKIVGDDVDAFHLRNVQQKEEIMRLHELLRNAQDQEQAARSRVKELELVVMRLERSRADGGSALNRHRGGGSLGTSDISLRERLAQMQDAIAKAYVQRTQLMDELAAAREMGQALEWRHEAILSIREPLAHSNPNNIGDDESGDDDGEQHPTSRVKGSLSHWRLRGKEAQLHELIAKKEQLITSLTSASREVEELIRNESVLKTPDGTLVEQLVAMCPGCGKGQWSSPFCSATGHRHAGFGAVVEAPTVRRKTVEAVLASGEWKKLVDVDHVKIVYEHRDSHKRVEDLEAELEREFKDYQSMKDAEKKSKPASPSSSPSKGVKRNESSDIRPGVDREIRTLLETVKERNAEVARLKALLKRMVESGGLAALPPRQFPDAAPLPAATPPLQALPLSGEVTPEEHALRLVKDNEALNARCSELVLELAMKEEVIEQQRKDIERLRFDGAPFSGEALRAAEADAEKARREALLERRRVASLHEEVRRLRELLPPS